jgi:hypothetical protein
VISWRSPYSEGEWDRWFAWYPVTVVTSKYSAHWVWLAFVERKWGASRYGGTGTRRRRYRLPHTSKPDVRQRLQNLKDLTQKLDVALGQQSTGNGSATSPCSPQSAAPHPS